MAATIVAVNLTASPIVLSGLGGTVPASSTLNLSDTNKFFEIAADPGLQAQLAAGNLRLDVNGSALTSSQSVAILAPEDNVLGIKDNFLATTAPVVGNDQTQGYSIGSRWINTSTGLTYICTSANTGAAVWVQQFSSNGVDPGAHATRHLPSGSDPLTTAAPVNITKAANAAGTANSFSRSDHKHDVTTATAVSTGTANAEGASSSLARADHTHAVTGFSISGQVQGDILYFNGTSWVRLPPGTAGETLTTQGAAANPSWAGPKNYPNSATNPVSPVPAAGDTYYNTALLMTMQYDAVRGKWLSIESSYLQFGRSGDLTPAGTYLRTINGMVMSATLGEDALYNGTVVGASIRRATVSGSSYAITASGTDIATVTYVAGQGVRTTTLNGDFVAGAVLAARLSSDAVVPETDVQMVVRLKWRV